MDKTIVVEGIRVPSSVDPSHHMVLRIFTWGVSVVVELRVLWLHRIHVCVDQLVHFGSTGVLVVCLVHGSLGGPWAVGLAIAGGSAMSCAMRLAARCSRVQSGEPWGICRLIAADLL